METFQCVNEIKKQLDRNLPKDKREIPIILVGTMVDLPGRQVGAEMASIWASKERGRQILEL